MVIRWLRATALIVFLMGTLGVHSVSAQEHIKGHVLARVATDIENQIENEVKGVCKDHGATVDKRTSKKGLVSLVTPGGKTDEGFVDELRGDGRIRFADLDKVLDLPRMSGRPFHFPFDRGNNVKKYRNQIAKTQINLGNAPQSAGAGVTVAVLDTGITANHAALKKAALAGTNFVNPSLLPNDIADTANSLAVGHGTMVSGVIALIAPKVKILPVRVLNADGKGSTLSVIQAIQYAVGQGAQVINMSFGAEITSEILDEVLEDAADSGVILVASAGNDGKESVLYPASHKDVLSVGSVDSANKKSAFSNYAQKLVLVAPGENIQSAFADGAYAAGSGTSFSAPFVSALAALLISEYPNKPVDWIKDQIRESAMKIDSANPTYKGKLGRGLIDVLRSLSGSH